jgi:type VI secretion system ImpM family protein
MIWPLRKRETLPQGAALVGKLPCQADFVREGPRGPELDSLDQLLVEAMPNLHSAGIQTLPLLWFSQCLPKQSAGLVGVCAPSRDAAGRGFPVAIARAFEREKPRTPGAEVGRIFASHRDFLERATDLIAQLPSLALGDVRAALGGLPQRDPDHAAASPQPPATSLAALLGDDIAVQSYALYAFASAFAARQPGLTLDCPVRDAATAECWLELAGRVALRTGTCPCVLYSPEPARLLIALDAWNPTLLRAIADPSHGGERVWPLTTETPAAREHAHAALVEAVPEILRARSLQIVELTEALARFSKMLRV